MREGILDGLPKALPKEKIVLVVGPPDYPGQNSVKSLIGELNRSDEWIRGEFREQISEAQVPNRASVVLTMTGLTHGSLVNVRHAASVLGAFCPNQALTPGETKEILRSFSQVRQGVVRPPVALGNHNGKGTVPASEKIEARQPAELPLADGQSNGQDPPAPIEETTIPDPETADPEEAAATADQSSSVPDEVEAALAAIEKFRNASSEAEVAVLMVGDRLNAVMAERNDLQAKLETQDIEIAELRSKLSEAEKSLKDHEAVLAENKVLKEEVQRLQKALDNLDALIRGVRQK